MEALDFSEIYRANNHSSPYKIQGRILSSKGLTYEVALKKAFIGANVKFITEFGDECEGEVVSISDQSCLVMPYHDLPGINSDTKVEITGLHSKVQVTDDYLGRVLDFRGQPLDEKGEIKETKNIRSLFGSPINPLQRPQITEFLDLGINAINGFSPIGKGQRISILAGSGVGKSVLLGMIAKNTKADVNVISLVGERGREVREFIENDLGEEGLKKSVIIVATSDTSPLIRMRSAYLACTISEYFRDQGKDVLFMMDSITRFAMAAREISLSAGEPPGAKGYTPSVFSKLPKILERAGKVEGKGSITGIYTVLVEGNDMDEPITDAIRAISDGHIQLSRKLASRNFYPAIDILNSISRLMNKVISKEHRIVASHLRDLLASYVESEDLINVGAYVKGSNGRVDKAIKIYDDLCNLLKQDQELSESLSMDELFDKMVEIARKAETADEIE